MTEVEQIKAYTNFLEQQLLNTILEISGIPCTTHKKLFDNYGSYC